MEVIMIYIIWTIILIIAMLFSYIKYLIEEKNKRRKRDE